MADDAAPPIPEAIWQRLREFVAAGKTGRITLHVSQGTVVDAEFAERVRAVVASRQT